jgi:superfamily I DNA and/or RNA helicase
MAEPHAISMFAGLRKFYPGSIIPLNVTYRLNSRLCDLIGRNFYGPEVGLYSHPSNADLMFPYEIAPKGSRFLTEVLDPTLSIVWVPVDTVDCGEENEEEARIAVQVIKVCMEGGVPVKEMVLVTPFRRQSARIRDMLQEATGTHLLPVIDTVERVQGMTVDLVVYSLCSSDHELLQSKGGFLFSLNRFNVALSRARTKVVILASPHALNCLPSSFAGFKARNTFRSILAFDCERVDPK